MTYVVGVDGSRDGWIAVRLKQLTVIGAASYPSFGELLFAEPTAAIIAVDMPIGLPLATSWPRRADMAARAFIGPLRSSVFKVPTIEALEAPSYAEAVLRCAAAGIPALSQQAYALGRKIFEVAEHALNPRVREVHPEVSFAAMNGRPLTDGKRTWNGHHERRRVLSHAGIEVPDELGNLGRAGVDDVLDAVAAGWSAARIAAGTAEHLPADSAAGSPRISYSCKSQLFRIRVPAAL